MSQIAENHRDMSNERGQTNGTMKDAQPKAAQSRGLTNGLGGGHTNGAGNGHAGGSGMTNGVGKTNGTAEGGRTNGLTNGLNSTNGSTGQTKFTPRRKQSPSRKSLSILIIIILIVTLLGSFVVLLPPPPPEKFVAIDSIFGDWDSKILYQDTATASDASLDIVNFSVAAENEIVYGYLHTRGNLQNKDSIERYMLFIDSDKAGSTGYSVNDIGADYAIEAYGWRNSSWSVQTSRFSGTDQRNWSAFKTIGTGSGKSSGDELEFAANIETTILPGGYYARFATASENATGEICTPKVDGVNGALVITQTPLDNSGIVWANNLLTLTLSASGKDVSINDIRIASSGVPETTISGLTAGMQIRSETPITVTVSTDISYVEAGTLVKASLATIDSNGTSSVTGRGLTAYVQGAPANVAIDGAFADWGGISKFQETAAPCFNSDIDVTEHAATTQQSNLYVYIGFNPDGQAFGGAISPLMRRLTRAGEPGESPVGTGASPSMLPRTTGEDVTRIYFDSMPNHGTLIGGINADFYTEIKGLEGDIISKRLYTYPERSLVSDMDVLAESGAHQLEVSVPNNLIESAGENIFIYIETTSWALVSDYTAMRSVAQPTVSGTRASPLPVNLGAAGDFAVLAGSTITNTGATVVTGNLGLSPGTAVVGFPPGTINGVIHVANATAAQAKIDLASAYNDIAGRTPVITVGGDTLGGLTLVPGVYHGGALSLTGTLNLTGDANAIWIIQAESTLDTTAGSIINLNGGAKASNVYWKVGTSATLGANSDFKGSILAYASITVYAGAAIEGRTLAQTAAVTLNADNIALPQSLAVINEVMFWPSSGDDWFELYNPAASNYDLSGWTLVDSSGTAIHTFPTMATLNSHAYARINVSGALDSDDYLSLLDSSLNIIDFVAWSTSSNPVGAGYTAAIAAGEWPSGAYVNTASLFQGNSIGRDQNSTDTNAVADWDITCGINAMAPTPAAQNIPEFQAIAVPVLFLLIIPMFVVSRRRRMPL